MSRIATIISQFKRSRVTPTVRNFSTHGPQFFRTTPCLMAEPLKKKKKLDPAIIRAREERKKKKIEKQIRRLEKNARQLKPIDECEVALEILDQKLERQRVMKHLPELLEKRALLDKKWANFKRKQILEGLQVIGRFIFHQQKAVDELKKVSKELYQEAIQPDLHMVPFKGIGPLETPPIDNYQVPDGDYQDISKKLV